MVEAPAVKRKEQSHLITPLLVKSHKYPNKIKKLIASESRDCDRGIGGYREVNWYFKERSITLWLTDRNR
jgi:hypothetical protein